jgi:hypothetical protein
MRRILLIASASLLLAACQSATAPERALAPSVASHDDILPPEGAVSDPSCRSGWSVAEGRCL